VPANGRNVPEPVESSHTDRDECPSGARVPPGIPPELLSRVFDRFFRGDAGHGSAIEGRGLGLSIAQWIVHAHRGTTRIESEAGGLTPVTVRLKICAASEP
jgi:signal transduction histidine kinase